MRRGNPEQTFEDAGTFQNPTTGKNTRLPETYLNKTKRKALFLLYQSNLIFFYAKHLQKRTGKVKHVVITFTVYSVLRTNINRHALRYRVRLFVFKSFSVDSTRENKPSSFSNEMNNTTFFEKVARIQTRNSLLASLYFDVQTSETYITMYIKRL